MIIPKEKELQLANAYKQIKLVEQQYRKGIITDGERYNKIIDIWTHAGDEISNVMRPWKSFAVLTGDLFIRSPGERACRRRKRKISRRDFSP